MFCGNTFGQIPLLRQVWLNSMAQLKWTRYLKSFLISRNFLLNITISFIEDKRYTLSGPAGSAFVWHTCRREFEPRLLQQASQFVGHVNTVQYVELKGYCPWGWGMRPVNWIYRLWRRCWLWSTATRSSPLGYFSRLLQVVDNWPHIVW